MERPPTARGHTRLHYQLTDTTMTPATPELDKLAAVREQSQTIGEFLDFMRGEDVEMCEPHGEQGYYLPTRKTIEQMLASFYEIDLAACEREREALLASLRG